MSRLVSLLIVLLAIAVATPVLAEDRLSLSGQMRVRGQMVDNQFDFNDDAAGANTFFDQRLRLAAKIVAAEGVSAHFRADLNEGRWGANYRPDFDFDQAFLTVDKQMFNLRAGRFYYGIGNAIAVDVTGDGAVFTLKGAVPVEIGYFKVAERTPLHRDNDIDLYTVAVKHSTDMYNAVVFGGYKRDGGRDAAGAVATVPGAVNDFGTAAVGLINNTDIYGIGVQTRMKLDPINLNFELNYFTGEENITNGRDYKGLQAYLDANMAISDTVTAGASFFYAQGQSGTDRQVTELIDDGSFLPETYSFLQGQYNIFPTGNGSLNTTFDPTGDDKGVIGVQVYGNFKVMDALSLRAAAGYWMMDEDYTTAQKTFGNVAYDATAYDSFITVVGSARYALAAKTNLDFVAAYTVPDGAHSRVQDDAALLTAFNLNVNF